MLSYVYMRLIVHLLLQDIQIVIRFSRDAYVCVSRVSVNVCVHACVRTYAAWHGEANGLDRYVGDVHFLEYHIQRRRRKIAGFVCWVIGKERTSCLSFSSATSLAQPRHVPLSALFSELVVPLSLSSSRRDPVALRRSLRR